MQVQKSLGLLWSLGVLFLVFMLSGAITIYCLLKLKAVCCSHGVNREVILYSVAAFLAASTSLWTFILQWRSEDSKKSWALFFATLTGCLLLLEVYAWKLYKDGINDPYAKISLVDQYRDTGVPAVPSIGGPLVLSRRANTDQDFLPLGGVSNVTTVFCNENGYMVTYQSDEHGFNNAKGVFQPGNSEVALVGDSYTEGACVWPKDNLAGVLNAHGYRTINLGRAGSGSLMELAITIEYVSVLRPKVLVWMFYNDFTELAQESVSPILMRYLNDVQFSQNLIRRQEEIDEFLVRAIMKEEKKVRANLDNKFMTEETITQIVKLYHLRKAFGLSGPAIKTYDFCPNNIDESFTLLISVLKRAKEVVAEWGGALVFVNLPGWDRLIEVGHHDAQRCAEWYSELAERLEALGIHYYDMFEILSKNKESPEIYFAESRPNHYSPEGYRVVAGEIARVLREDRLLE